ncbi:MAG: YfiR family protein [Sedimentisphaerales bacterium]|nr:YfiR family protein [Sedimentisphaerales bacterium]
MKQENQRTAFCTIITALVMTITPCLRAETESSQEYKVKAAFLYNFINFVDWPKEKMGEPNEPILLGIIGKDPFANAFEPVKNKQIKNRKVVVKRLKSVAELKKLGPSAEDELARLIDAAKKCHLVFVCSSEQECLKDILSPLKDLPILTVADTKDFLQAGGIVNFVMIDNKVRFEISDAAAKLARLKLRSQLLRLAAKVVK